MKPNHKDGCDGQTWRHSGDGYNRVRVCACGAEDHDPTRESVRAIVDKAIELARDWDGKEPWDDHLRREQGR